MSMAELIPAVRALLVHPMFPGEGSPAIIVDCNRLSSSESGAVVEGAGELDNLKKYVPKPLLFIQVCA